MICRIEFMASPPLTYNAIHISPTLARVQVSNVTLWSAHAEMGGSIFQKLKSQGFNFLRIPFSPPIFAGHVFLSTGIALDSRFCWPREREEIDVKCRCPLISRVDPDTHTYFSISHEEINGENEFGTGFFIRLTASPQ